MKKILMSIGVATLVVIGFLSFSAFKAEEKSSKYILVEIYEIPKYSDNGVHIHLGDGKTEYIPFMPFKSEHHDDNGDIILKAINKLTDDGYEITHTAAGLANSGMITKVFMQKK